MEKLALAVFSARGFPLNGYRCPGRMFPHQNHPPLSRPAFELERAFQRLPAIPAVLPECVVISFAIPWSQEKKKTNKRTSTRNFLEHLNADNHRRAFDLVTSKAPSAWEN